MRVSIARLAFSPIANLTCTALVTALPAVIGILRSANRLAVAIRLSYARFASSFIASLTDTAHFAALPAVGRIR